jgi:hypothetical protein
MAIERIGKDAIRSGFDMYKASPYYALFETLGTSGRFKAGRLLYAYKGEDLPREGWKLLEDNLQVIEANAPTSPVIIQFYDKLGKGDSIDSSTPYAGSFLFRMREREYTPAISGVSAGGTSSDFLNYLQNELLQEKQKNLLLQDEVDDLKAELDEVQEQQPKKEKITGIIGAIGEAGNQFPWLAEVIKDWSTVFKHKMSNNFGGRQQPHGGIAGVPGTDAPPRQQTGSGSWAQRYEAARQQIMTWYAKEYGDLQTAEGREKGCHAYATDMELLASLTEDDDMMRLALKKLRALE